MVLRVVHVQVGSTEVWPMLDIRKAEGPGAVLIPADLLEKIEWARLMIAKAEGDLYDWMLENGVRPEEVKEILAQHEQRRLAEKERA